MNDDPNRLRFATPDLLAALQQIVRCARLRGPHGIDCYAISKSRMDAARAAIANQSTMKTFTVVGYYPDTEQRFCNTVKAGTVRLAQNGILHNFAGVVICGVFAGALTPVDLKFTKVSYDKDYLP